MKEKDAQPEQAKSSNTKRTSQSEMPQYSFEDVLDIAKAFFEKLSGKSSAPADVAEAASISSRSSTFRYKFGALKAYGLTTGGYNADVIELTELALNIFAPTSESADSKNKSILEAILKPKTPSLIYNKFNNAKLPPRQILENQLVRDYNIPKDSVGDCYDIIIGNGIYAGILKKVNDDYLVNISPTAQESSDEIKDFAPASISAVEENNNRSDLVKPKASSEKFDFNSNLQVNIEIHISHELSNEQIEKVFEAMGKHLFRNV
ncbi:MAG: hypothetical protein SFY70_08535 [Bacteroidia bacterium]|nr:hypothetical protein [Bacteroidia bacterium]